MKSFGGLVQVCARACNTFAGGSAALACMLGFFGGDACRWLGNGGLCLGLGGRNGGWFGYFFSLTRAEFLFRRNNGKVSAREQ